MIPDESTTPDLVELAGRIGATRFQLRDGRAIGLVVSWDRDRALADLGLAE